MDVTLASVLIGLGSAALGGALSAFITARVRPVGGRELALVAALQADGEDLRAQLGALGKDVSALRDRLDAAERRGAAAVEYAVWLRLDISQMGVEPRPWPVGLP